MKKLIQILSLSSLAFVGLTSCESDTTTLNNDPKNPVVVPSINVLTTASYYLANQHVSPSVNENITRFFTQQWTETTYTGETNYYFDQRNQNQFHFNNMFREVIAPLAKAKTYVASESEDLALSATDVAKIKANKVAIMEILSVFAWANLVDTYGDIPYSEALKSDASDLVLQPKYDDAATIYADLEKRINAVLATISTDMPSYYTGTQLEQFYPEAQNMDHWVRVANTIKLQMGLNLADVNNAKAKTLVESAVAGGVITTAGNTLQFLFDSGQFTNPVYQNLVASGRNDFLPSNVYVNFLKANKDPRRISYFAENLNRSLGTVSTVVGAGITTITFGAALANVPTVGQAVFINDNGVGLADDTYVGDVVSVGPNFITLQSNGTPVSADMLLNFENYVGGTYGTLNTYGNFTRVTDKIKRPSEPGILYNPTDVKFMLAEAAARNFNVGGTAATYYTEAITSSMNEWNVSAANTATFLASHPYDSANWQKSIGEAAWVAMYNRGIEAWNFWRRLDYPVLNNAPTAEFGLVKRMPYPLNERNNNAANVAAAAAKINGGDRYSSRVFWDIK
ncbi:SusD/RagB family nutrient-binding outer membrane lipoprotein [Epilithonimonas sp. JDS]|uniref:SusD/RagB family nutrient-binding outer membrane lipoprotein n=1 Tax=Epilithonimonas sp. JDS TaxID=2902797 RepID=UPI001E366506|nr:SusD/RagB family nutrient-binding outer membrane lipoprotein [Epilithonimonas sp. JDS]MCD9856389.1 SusD/RagB family nutrient-binding outer membrane lipoprotein [Epilithonimonas sp. JDS]